MIEIDCAHNTLIVHESNSLVKYTVVCEESLKQVVLDLLKEFSLFLQHVRDLQLPCRTGFENLARQLNLICVMISSLGDAGLNSLMVCNNMQSAYHKEMMLAQKEHRHL